ncbi:MAG: primosomal protein N' [bacterium]|nr:primosomal protein N' [bacterium]
MTARPRHASVAIPIPVRRQFTYLVPEPIAARLSVGARVRVPFGARRVEGTVIEWPAAVPAEEIELKSIHALVDELPPLQPAVLELTRFVADYYLCSWGEALEAATPGFAGKDPLVRRIHLLPGGTTAKVSQRAAAQRELLQALSDAGEPLPLARLTPRERRAAVVLVERGLAAIEETREAPQPPQSRNVAQAERPLDPMPEQAAALERILPAIESGEYAPMVLHGVTGSGKTEVYLRAARHALDRGRSVLYLVPEIGLTPLLLSRVSRRFPGQVAVLHSALPRARRWREWQSVHEGRCRLVIGTRSAVFAPLSDIGLIVVDEEHDGSYKQDETPRYNGRDVAIVRARAEKSVVLLGSATPSMESFHNAQSGRFALLQLGSRVEDRPLARVGLVDMRQEYGELQQASALSRVLLEELEDCLERKEQALILRNRRGWAAALLCPRCGNRVNCTSCSIALTWHLAERRLRCHTCDAEHPYPECCPTCANEELKPVGEGTEKIEDLIRDAIPGARVERMDRDTIRRRGAHEKLLGRFGRGEIDVLVGTQMIAKGHDFPRVTLVGVVSADQSLGLPDFRAGERTFQLLTQVAGRAGRGERPGRVVVQAFDVDHPILRLAAVQDYEAFFQRELDYRRALRYPPLAALVQLRISDPDELQSRAWAGLVADAVRDAGDGKLLISGPGPAPVERMRGRYRQQILVRSDGRRRVVDAVDRALNAIGNKVPSRALQVDVDPLSLL